MVDVKASIEQVAKHYKNFDPHWNLKPLERRLATTLLACGYTAEQLCDAITGLYLDPWHNGKNNDGKKWLSFSYAMRENMVDKYIKLAQEARKDEIRARKRREEKAKKERQDQITADDMKERAENGYNISSAFARQMAGASNKN
jgi:phage protein D